MSFEKLLEELETMTKALPAEDGKDDEKIQAAAEGGEGMDGDKDTKETLDLDKDEDEDGDEDEKGEPMGKSFSLKLEDGTEIDAVDGTELVKSLMARVETNESAMTKALGVAVDLIKSQGDMIKSLQDKVTKLAGEGRGRKTVVSVSEKPAPAPLAKSETPAGVSPQEFMAKALSAQAAGKLSGQDIAIAEGCLNRGMAIPARIVAAVQ